MKVFLCSLILLLSGCTFSGTDITQPWIRLKPPAPHESMERVEWIEYTTEEVEALPQHYEGCGLFYFKTPYCNDCDLMDKAFMDSMIVAHMDMYFRAFKATSDNPHWEAAIQNFDVQDVPFVVIVNYHKGKVNIVSSFGYVSSTVLNDIIMHSVVEHCRNDTYN